MNRDTIFSPDRLYRYTLWRRVPSVDMFMKQKQDVIQFIGLNPSTADEVKNDPTIRKCLYFAFHWGFQWLCMTNIFAFRATDPEVMKAHSDPIGPENDRYLLEVAKEADLIIAAWGVHGEHLNRGMQIRSAIPNLQCLGINSGGTPKHPLYLRSTVTPMPYALPDPQAA